MNITPLNHTDPKSLSAMQFFCLTVIKCCHLYCTIKRSSWLYRKLKRSIRPLLVLYYIVSRISIVPYSAFQLLTQAERIFSPFFLQLIIKVSLLILMVMVFVGAKLAQAPWKCTLQVFVFVFCAVDSALKSLAWHPDRTTTHKRLM